MGRTPHDDEVTQQNVALYVDRLVVWARTTGPKSLLDKPVVVLHKAFGLVLFPVVFLQVITTAVLGCLVSITFGMLLFPLSVLWWPFLGFLLCSSWLWTKVSISRFLLALPGVLVAEIASAFVALMPSMGEWQSRGVKLAMCESWPHSLLVFQRKDKDEEQGDIPSERME